MEQVTRALMQRHKRGFSATELLILGLFTLITLTVMASILMRMYGNVVVESHKVLLRAEAQAVAHRLYNELQATRSFSSEPTTTLVDTHAPANGWRTNPTTLITKQYLYTRHSKNPTERPILLQSSCTDPAPSHEIYFTTQNTDNDLQSLYRRTVAPTADSLCDTTTVRTTCPTDANQAGCPSDDLLSNRITEFSVQYLDVNGNPLPVLDTTATPESAQSARIYLTLSEVAYGKTIKESASVLIYRHDR